MMVFKFGGASVKDAEGIRNLSSIVRLYEKEQLIIVVSAMGKTTNALEKICDAFYNRTGEAEKLLDELKYFHIKIASDLFSADHFVFSELNDLFAELHWAIEEEQIKEYDYEYDQIISVGELLSTKVVAAFLNQEGQAVTWIDARDMIRTDSTFREGNVDWEITGRLVKNNLEPLFSKSTDAKIITQGFIGSTSENFTTTLGREGSDYTAAILAYCMDASEVFIWKDVAGVLNADPKMFPDAQLLPELSYYDAIELAYYGATIIHPKTIKPLQNKCIPLRVKSFLFPNKEGTRISEDNLKQVAPTYIFKTNQVLFSVSPRDFSFIIEENIRDIFEQIALWRIKVNLMQNSALNFSVCVDNEAQRLPGLLAGLKSRFRVLYNEDCELITIHNYNESLVEKLIGGRNVLVEQRSRETIQLVIR